MPSNIIVALVIMLSMPAILLFLIVFGIYKLVKWAFDYGFSDKEKAGYVND